MKAYGSFCPVSKASAILAERWTPLIIRELLMGSHRFSELETGVPGIPRALLAQRLRSLEAVGVIARRLEEHGKVRYDLTEAGHDLMGVVLALGEWGQRWVNHDIAENDLDPTLLMWDMRRRIHVDRLPARRVVVQFDFTGARNRSYWLVLESDGPSVCFNHPGFEVDVVVTADTIAMHRVWMGRLPMAEALRTGAVRIEGPRDLVRDFPSWLALSTFAGIAPARSAVMTPA